MNKLWPILIAAGLTVALLCGRADESFAALLDAGGSAIALCITLAGAYALWCGFMNVARKAGVLAAFTRLMKKPLGWVFPGVPRGDPAMEAIAVNLSANALGLGNAALPAGLEAMRELRRLRPNGIAASDDMVMFLVINCSSIQLIPTTVIALRAAAGASAPADILLPGIIASGVSTLVGIAAAHGLKRLFPV